MSAENNKIIKNVFIYSIKQISSILFPLLTFAYSARILGVEGIGKVNYSQSIANYFVILSGLGISTYAIKTGSSIRDDKNKINKMVSELFTINLISTIISVVFFLLIVLSVSSLNKYKSLLFCFGLLIPFTTLGIEWIYNIFEDFKYITIRSIVVQVISFVLMIVFVRSESDLLKYAIITVFASVGSNIFNFLHAKQYISLSFKNIDIKYHIKPIIFLFGMTIATTIYTTMDTTMLGILSDDYQVGLYSAAHKVTKMLILIVATIRTVSLPVLSRKSSETKQDDFKNTASNILNVVILISIPIMVGVMTYKKFILFVMSGEKYYAADKILQFLAIDILLSAISGTLVYQYVLLKKGEKGSFLITLLGSVVNLLLNIIFIIKFNGVGAALATCISESVVLIIAFIISKEYIEIKTLIKSICIGIVASIPIPILFELFVRDSKSVLLNMIFIVSSVVLYFSIIVLFGDNAVSSIIRGFIRKGKTDGK